jgi:hypothetical protein
MENIDQEEGSIMTIEELQLKLRRTLVELVQHPNAPKETKAILTGAIEKLIKK